MIGTRALGIIGLDAASAQVARHALDAGSSILLLENDSERSLIPDCSAELFSFKSLDALVAALPRPRSVLLGLASDGLRAGPMLGKALGLLDEGDLVLACSCESWFDLDALRGECGHRGLALMELGALGGSSASARGRVSAGGSPEDRDRAAALLGEDFSLLGGLGAGGVSAVIRCALEGLQIELLAESYHVLRSGIKASHDEMRTVFAQWNQGDLADPLLAATADALGLRDDDGEPLVEKVLDAAAARGPCSKAAAMALAAGVPAPMNAQAAAATAIAALKDERFDASAVLGGPKAAPTGDRQAMSEELRKAYVAAGILAAAECVALLGLASERRKLRLDLTAAVKLWNGSRLVERAVEALGRSGGRWAILLDAAFKTSLDQCLPSLRRVVARALESGIPVPAFSAALCSYDAYRSTWLPASLSNALRDSIHGIGYERIDRPRGELFHSEWK